MSTPPSEYASFLVRLWHEDSVDLGETVVDWHGEIEHIQSGERLNFGTVDELLNHLRQQTNNMKRTNK